VSRLLVFGFRAGCVFVALSFPHPATHGEVVARDEWRRVAGEICCQADDLIDRGDTFLGLISTCIETKPGWLRSTPATISVWNGPGLRMFTRTPHGSINAY
jgi:hypothetical protein